jgi:hypothetical protein
MKGVYKNEVERPAQPMQGSMEKGMGMKEFKGQADDLAYGQAGAAGCRSDDKKISAQMKDYHWTDGSGNSGY